MVSAYISITGLLSKDVFLCMGFFRPILIISADESILKTILFIIFVMLVFIVFISTYCHFLKLYVCVYAFVFFRLNVNSINVYFSFTL